MPNIRMPSSTEIDKAYKESLGRVPGRYKEGIARVTDFKERAIAGQNKYEAQMSNPDVLKRREAKLAEMPDNEWKEKAGTLGAERIAKGMSANAAKRARNYEPIRNALDGMALPDSTTDADTNIDNRLKPVVHAMRKAAGKE